VSGHVNRKTILMRSRGDLQRAVFWRSDTPVPRIGLRFMEGVVGWACAFVLSELDDIVAERTRGFSCF